MNLTKEQQERVEQIRERASSMHTDVSFLLTLLDSDSQADDADGVFIFRHAPDCVWERTTSAQCEYRDTHHYCPHPEHACTCPEISGELSDNPTLEEAEAYLHAQGVDLKAVADDFIERLLHQNLELKQQVAKSATVAATTMRDKCVEEVKEMANEIEANSKVQFDDAAMVAHYLRKAATVLESLTLDQVEQEKHSR